jgi:hypothetical protein
MVPYRKQVIDAQRFAVHCRRLLAVHSSQPFFAFADAIAESDRSSVDLLPLEDDGDAE